MHLQNRIFVLIGLILVTACDKQHTVQTSGDNSKRVKAKGMVRNHEFIAQEIIRIKYSFKEAMVLVTNTNDAAEFAVKVDTFVMRLEEISKELDSMGPFPTSLCETTLKEIDANENILDKHNQTKDTLKPLGSDAAKILEDAADKYFTAWISVAMKSGLTVQGM